MSDELNNINNIENNENSLCDEIKNAAPNDDATFEYISQDEFAAMLEQYPPTPENTDKLKQPIPDWAKAAVLSFAICFVMLAIYSVAVVPHIKPSAVISYVANSERTEEHETGIRAIADSVSKSIVTVESNSSQVSFFGISSQTTSGSGVIISADGYILTSNSLIGDGNDITVTLSDKSDYSAKLIGRDDSKDIAILKIDASNLSAAVLGNSDNAHPGDMSVVIGNVLGKELGASVTKGIICGINNGVTLQSGNSINLIQTDAITNTQSAGGCLLNSNGEVIGMITYAVSANADNISFAIPSNDIKNIFESLVNTGSAPQGLVIGITGTDNDHGVTVESVLDDTPAKAAGIKSGDLILKVDNIAVKSISEINKIRDSHSKGDKIIITLYRDGNTMDVEIVL